MIAKKNKQCQICIRSVLDQIQDSKIYRGSGIPVHSSRYAKCGECAKLLFTCQTAPWLSNKIKL